MHCDSCPAIFNTTTVLLRRRSAKHAEANSIESLPFYSGEGRRRRKMEKNTKDIEITKIVLRFVSIQNSSCTFDAFRIAVVPMLSKTVLNAHKIVLFLNVYE